MGYSRPVAALSRFEHISDITLSAKNTTVQLQSQGGNLPMDRFIHSLRLQFAGRFQIPAAGGGGVIPTAINADAPWSVIERVVVSGYHRLRGTREEFINLRGADLAELNRLYTSHDLYKTPATQSIVADANNDTRFIVDIPFVPLKMPARKQTEWLLDAPNYDNLQLTIYYANDANLYTLGTGEVLFSSFGADTGSPVIRVSGKFAQAGASFFKGFVPGRVWRYFEEKTGTDITAVGTRKRLFNVPRGHRMRSILLKVGVKATTTSGYNAFLTLSHDALSNIRVLRGTNKVIRQYINQYDIAEETGMDYAVRANTGFGLIDFAPHGLEDELLDLRSLIAGPTGDVDTFIEADVAAAAGQAAVAIYEEWRGFPTDYTAR